MKTQDVDGMSVYAILPLVEANCRPPSPKFSSNSEVWAANLLAIWKDHLEPKGWRWARWGDGVWTAQPPGMNPTMIEVLDTGDFLTDFSRLTLKALLAQKESEGGKG